jgi:hypothetical protein
MRTGFAACLLAALLLQGCGGDDKAAGGGDTTSKDVALGAPVDVVGTATKPPYGEVKLRLVVDVEQGAIKDLEDFNLSPEERSATPYYVHEKLTNLDKPVTGGAGIASLTAFDDSDRPAKALTLLGTFPACESRAAPDVFATDASFSDCGVYLVPKGRKLARLVHRETHLDGPSLLFTWQVP